jgi:hypothetical protein
VTELKSSRMKKYFWLFFLVEFLIVSPVFPRCWLPIDSYEIDFSDWKVKEFKGRAAYANRHFQLTASGQRVVLYFAPHPPVRQKMLNGMISDAFYRELFMNPCLSGWAQGESKFLYMNLCHQVLSRSQLNIIPKLTLLSINNDTKKYSLEKRKSKKHGEKFITSVC